MNIKKLLLLSLIFFSLHLAIGQEGFQINGVKNNFEPIFAFKNATIVVSPQKTIEKGTLIIKGEKIISVDTSSIIPEGAIISDLNGDFIYPSFIDLYSDYGLPEIEKHKGNSYSPQYKSNKIGAYHWNQAIHPEINASDEFNVKLKSRQSYLNNGFGAVLTHFQDGIFRGTGTFVLLSNKSEQENILRSKSATFYSFKKGVSTQKNPSSLMGSIALIRQSLLDAEWYETQNDQTNLSYEAYNNTNKLPKIFSINDVLDYQRIEKIADEFEIEFIIKGTGKEYSRIKEVAKLETPIIVPLNFPNPYDVSNPETTEWISLSKLKDWESAPFNLTFLINNDIKFCITSSDLENDKDFLKNLRTAIKKGLKKSDALASLTINPAEIINMNSNLGTLEAGKLANFFVSSDDIFENGIVYENWIAGQKNIINQKSLIDIRGYYTFNSAEYNDLFTEINGEKENPNIKITFLDSSAFTCKVIGSDITINSKDGNFRAIAKLYDNNSIKGRYQNIEGNFFDFSLSKDSAIEIQEIPFVLELTNTIPSVWNPNKSYGFEKLPEQESIIFRNATVWTNEKQGILLNTDVIISEGKIIGIGTLLNPLDYFKEGEFRIIDASQMHLTCGIIDEHSHIAISRGVNEGTQSVSAEVRIEDVIKPTDHNIYRQLAGGTVAAQLLHGSANPIGGQSAIIKFRWGQSAEKMKIQNADGFIKFALGENVKQSNWGDRERIRFPQTRMGVEQVFYDAFYRALEYERSWKEYNSLPLKRKKKTVPPREDLELNALVEILNSERFITCHSYVQSEINMLMHVADSMGFKVNTFTHILEGYKVAKKMKEHGAGGSTFSDWWAYKFEVNDAIPHNATLLNNSQVLTAINSDDAEMGRRLNQEAAKAVKYGGTSEEDAWKMITLNPAKLLHIDNRMGSIKVGKDADIVLWTENPLSVYSKVNQTYVDGILLFDKKRDLELRKRDLKERMRIIQLMSKDKATKRTQPNPEKEKLYHCDDRDEE